MEIYQEKSEELGPKEGEDEEQRNFDELEHRSERLNLHQFIENSFTLILAGLGRLQALQRRKDPPVEERKPRGEAPAEERSRSQRRSSSREGRPRYLSRRDEAEKDEKEEQKRQKEDEKSAEEVEGKFDETALLKLLINYLKSEKLHPRLLLSDKAARLLFMLIARLLQNESHASLFCEKNGLQALLALKYISPREQNNKVLENIVLSLVEEKELLEHMMENVIRHSLFYKHQEVAEKKAEVEDDEAKKQKTPAKGTKDKKSEK